MAQHSHPAAAQGEPRGVPASVGWSSDGMSAEEAFTSYRTALDDMFVPLAAIPRGERFRARIDHVAGRDLRMSTVRAGAHEIRRTAGLIDRADDAYLLATVHLAGHSAVRQDGRESELVPGALVFCDSTRPFDFAFDGPFEQLVVEMPRTLLQARSDLGDRATERVTGRPLEPTGPTSVITRFLSSLASTSQQDPGTAASLEEHTLGLLGTALGMAAGVRQAEAATREMERVKVLEFLRANHVNPQLSADDVARGCHLSRRSLFRLFADVPMSVADELRRIRVEHACRLVRARPQLSVAAIAASSGFAGETQLYRAFRTVLGRSLTTYRAGVAWSVGSGA